MLASPAEAGPPPDATAGRMTGHSPAILSAPAGPDGLPPGREPRGERHAGAIAGSTLLAMTGLLAVWLGVARSRQHRAEKKLLLSEDRFSRIFRATPAAMSIIRQSDGRIMDVNAGWEAITGRSRAEAIGRTPVETGMIAGGDAEGRFRQFLESGKPLQDHEHALHTRDGSTRWLSLSTELLTLRDEPCFVVVAKDVTEPREAEEARQQLARTSRLALLGEMTASIAHEVNQPLGAILSNADAAEMLLELPVPPLDEVRRILADIRRDDLRASAVIKRVRAFIGRQEMVRVPLDLNAVLRETLRLARHDAHRRGVTLSDEFTAGLPEVHADAVQVEQVVLNLLLNAMDAMRDTPVSTRRVVVRSSRKCRDTVAISVEDRGHGIPPGKLARVFDSFFTTRDDGMGLGLALARSIAEAHGGSLSAENNSASGATFHFILPLNPHAAHDRLLC